VPPDEPKPEQTGSIDVQVSGGIPVPAEDLDSKPVASGRVVAVTGHEPSTRTKRQVMAEALGDVSTKLGEGTRAIGGVVERIGEATSKVPLVGSSVTTLGVGITTVGESLVELPKVARTRRGRVLLRSMIVGFLVVGAWIGAIVGYQMHESEPADFRQDAEAILVDLSAGKAKVDAVYESSSPRFQEMERKEKFEDDMADQLRTLGKFREITAINETLVTTGPTGKIGRVSLTAVYDKGTCRGSVSFHYDDDKWKFLGVGIELPPGFAISKEDKENRVQACKDPMDAERCDLHRTARGILAQLNDRHAADVWDNASDIFQKQEAQATFVQVQTERLAALGAFKRFVQITEAKVISGTSPTNPNTASATFDGLGEYDRGVARTAFSFVRPSSLDACVPRGKPCWKLRMLKVVVPMPRPEDDPKGVKPGHK
jgi:hypothetical protein